MDINLFTSWAIDPKYSWILFVGTFAILWLIAVAAGKYLGKRSLIYFIGGNDDRLSLAKFQVFLWTFVVMSSYVALMFIYVPQADPADPTKILQWVIIPTQILMLMGISISGGVLSSVISSVADEQRTAFVDGIVYDDAKSEITITGGNFGTVVGAVRIHLKSEINRKWELSIKEGGWTDNKIVVLVEKAANNILKSLMAAVQDSMDEIRSDVFGRQLTKGAKEKLKAEVLKETYEWEATPEQEEAIRKAEADLIGKKSERDILIVDTKHGKAAYFIIFDPDMRLGRPTVHYEFVDFFRDDLNPKILSIFKYQLFSWTLVAVVLYIYKFLQLNQTATTLPEVSSTVVILTGASTAGYLAGKYKPAGS